MKLFFSLINMCLLSLILSAQSHTFHPNFKIEIPEYIPINSSFEISTVTRITDLEIDNVNLYFLSKAELDLDKVVYKSKSTKKELEFEEINFEGDWNKKYKINVDLIELNYNYNLSFQIIFFIESFDLEESEISFDVEYLSGEEIAERIFSSQMIESPIIYPVKFYKPQITAGKSLVFEKKSHLAFSINEQVDIQNLFVEFWAKIDSTALNFFNIINLENNDTLLGLSNNEFQTITCGTCPNIEIYSDHFLCKNAWNYFLIEFSRRDNSCNVYANSRILFSYPFIETITLDKLKFLFNNESGNNKIIVDRFKIWDFNNSLNLAFSNRNFVDYKADSSTLICNFNFDDEHFFEEIHFNELINIDVKNVKFISSDAPIFSRAPELNINPSHSFYSIEWHNNDIENAELFIVEQSTDGKIFDQIYSTSADLDAQKIYYHTLPIEAEHEIVYFRVKQMNKDGSSVYSTLVKIGQGEKELFSIEQNYPNPFNPRTNITIEVFASVDIEIIVYDIVGRQIEKLHEGTLSEGIYTYTFDGTNLPSGIYFYEVKSPTSALVQKMILAK